MAAALLGAVAPTGLAAPAATTTSTTTAKTMKHLLEEIDQLRTEVETNTKTLEKIDTSKKKIAENRDRALEGRTKVRTLTERVVNMQTQVTDMTPEKDPTWPAKTFDKTKKNGLKTLGSLTSKLNHADKHLEKITGTASVPEPKVEGQAETVPATTDHPKGIGALVSEIPIAGAKKTETPVPTTPPIGKSPEHDDEDDDDDDDDIVSSRTPEPPKRAERSSIPQKQPSISDVDDDESDEDEDEDDDDDDDDETEARRQMTKELKNHISKNADVKESVDEGRRSRSPRSASPRKQESVRASPSPRPKKSTAAIISTPVTPKKSPSPRRHKDDDEDEESEDDSYFEDDEQEQELEHFRETGEHDEAEEPVDYDEGDEEENVVNARVQALRSGQYPSGTQFRATHDFTGTQTGDLTMHRGDLLTLLEQQQDDWWLFQHVQNQQKGVAPLNHVELIPTQQIRQRIKPNTSANVLIDAFKTNKTIPQGFVTSDLAALSQLDEYQLYRTFVPKMTDSNLAFVDVHWRSDTDQLRIQEVTYQKILNIKECVKIPKIKGEQIRVLSRCVRVCLYDGSDIISNIHVIRAYPPQHSKKEDPTEDWEFVRNDLNTLIDEQSQLLIRSSRLKPGQNLQLLFELSQWCQSTVTEEKCEIACGWTTVPLDDDKPPFITDTKNYNELLKGGHIDESNVLLDPQYLTLKSDGLSGLINRLKRARIKFSLESREEDTDVLYDNLPARPLVVPINLVKSLVFFRNELAYQFHKRRHPTGLSTTPIDSIFLSTFFEALSQSDLIDSLHRLYRVRRRRNLTPSASAPRQREEFIRTYELFIYPLLHYRQLPPYDFHSEVQLKERRTLIDAMIKRQIPRRKAPAQDIVSILLDPTLTDSWRPFSTDEIGFTLQKYTQNFASDVVM